MAVKSPWRLGLLGTALLAGCSGSTPSANSASDRASAGAINLVASDLPGFLAADNHDPTGGPAAAKLAHCAGAPSPAEVDVVEVSSPTFTAAVGQAQEQFSSEVTMVRTAAEAGADVATLRRPAVIGCLRSELTAQLQPSLPAGAELGPVSVSRFSPSGTSVPAVGLRLSLPVTATESGASARVVVTADLVEFNVGRAVVSLDVSSTGSVSPSAEESRLTGLLGERAKRVRQ